MTTPVWTPEGLPYPLTVDSLIPTIGTYINKGDRIFAYKFWYMVEIASSPDDNNADSNNTSDSGTENGPLQRKRTVRESVDFFESPFEGVLMSWNIDVNDEINGPMISICDIKRPCNHDVVYNGLCTMCGKEVDENELNIMSISGNNLTVSHTDTNLKISRNEATNLDNELQKRLREQKKLILVVDLDQTVIHCGVDPTIGEWKNDPTNPNYDTLKDVRLFALEEEPILPFMYVGEKKPPARKCWYYVKIRPGLNEFFAKLAPLFEMYIYTMATRSYALEITKIIDPDGSLFGGRIISRDENGSLTQKSLERLFPTDQSMVIIIDDRGDVWNWSPNLIKVIPYNFFVGVGDINSNFLPKQQPTMLQLGRRSREKEINNENFSNKKEDNNQVISNDKDIPNNKEDSAKTDLQETDELLTDIMNTEKNLQEEIDEEVKRKEATLNKAISIEETVPPQIVDAQSKEEWTKKLEFSASVEVQQKNRPLAKLQKTLNNKRLLIDDDDELFYLKDTIANIHHKYYNILSENPEDADITKIIPNLKRKVLYNCNFVFSGLIPLNTDIQRADIVIWTNNFGATTYNDIDDSTTHLITKTPTTYKARLAKAFNPDIKIVHPDWIFECLITWSKVDEKPYTLIVDQPIDETELNEYKEKLKKKELEAEEKQLQREEIISNSLAQVNSLELFGQGTSWLDDEDGEEIPVDEEEDEDEAEDDSDNKSDDYDEADTTVLNALDDNDADSNSDSIGQGKRILDLESVNIENLSKKPHLSETNKEPESDSDLEDELLNMLDD